MYTWARRVSVVLLSITLAAASSVAVAYPAAAAPESPTAQTVAVQQEQDFEVQSVSDCVFYLFQQGYPPIPAYVDACEIGASGSWFAYIFCYAKLASTGVIEGTADLACKLAAA